MVSLLLLCNLSIAEQVESKQEKLPDSNTWRESIVKARQQKDEEFKNSSTSPMAGVKRLTVKPGKKTFIIENKNGIALSNREIPGCKSSLIKKESGWYWEPLGANVTCRSGKKELKSGEKLPGRAIIKVGRFTLPVYPAGESLTLLVFDPERPEIKEFSHLLYYAPDRKYAVPAQVERLPDLRKVIILTSRNQEKTFYRYAKIRFKLMGKELTLTAFKFNLIGPGSDILFIPFMDKTSDIETYGGGRFLEVPEPLTAAFTLDFNLCFNPLCNYAPIYNYAVPPRANILNVPIKAGEKTYPH
ncbi:DUF1684 domain-containing protein [Acidobacteriota bacterium]